MFPDMTLINIRLNQVKPGTASYKTNYITIILPPGKQVPLLILSWGQFSRSQCLPSLLASELKFVSIQSLIATNKSYLILFQIALNRNKPKFTNTLGNHCLRSTLNFWGFFYFLETLPKWLLEHDQILVISRYYLIILVFSS